jgi:hypothetical protein
MPTDRLKPGLKAEIVTAVDANLVVKQGGEGVPSAPSTIGLSVPASRPYRPISPRGTPPSASR